MYCPGGSFASTPARRPEKPREMIAILSPYRLPTCMLRADQGCLNTLQLENPDRVNLMTRVNQLTPEQRIGRASDGKHRLGMLVQRVQLRKATRNQREILIQISRRW